MGVVIPYTYANYKCIIMWVMETLGIFLREPNYGVVDSCHLWDVPCQLDILNHLYVGLACLFGRTRSRAAPYNHPYASQGWPRALIFFSGRLSLGLLCPFLTDEPLQLPLPDDSFYLLLQVIAFGSVVTVIAVETVILVFYNGVEPISVSCVGRYFHMGKDHHKCAYIIGSFSC